MKKLPILAAATPLLFLATTPAYAFTCEGKVTYISLEGSDFLKTDIGYGQWVVCRLSTNYSVTSAAYGTYNITPETCQGLLSQLTTAKAKSGRVQAYIWGTGTCPVNLPSSAYAYAWVFPD